MRSAADVALYGRAVKATAEIPGDTQWTCQVADDLGLPRWWLNEQASTHISGKDDTDKRRVFDHPGLRVMAASPRHIFAMKAHTTSTIFACSPTLSEWNQPTRPCRYARTSTRTNPYPRDPPPCSANFSTDHSNFGHLAGPDTPPLNR
jgi:hypothetical protein